MDCKKMVPVLHLLLYPSPYNVTSQLFPSALWMPFVSGMQRKGQCTISEPGLQEVMCTSTLSFSILHHQTCSLLEYETTVAKPKSALLPKLRTRI